VRLFINGRFAVQPLSGVQRFAVEIAGALQASDARYALLTPPGGSGCWPGAREVGRWTGQGWEQMDLPRAVVGGLLINLGNTGPVLARRQIVVIHDAGVFSTPQAYSQRFRLWYKFLQAALIRRGAAIITVSEFSRQEILRHLPARPAQVRVIPEGADHMRRTGTDPGILAEHGLEPGRFVLGVGTAAEHKNLSALGLLAQRLHERGTPLVLAGGMGGAAFQAVQLPQLARYIGRVSDAQLKTLYQNAGCFVFPSRYEGFGLPPVEAMACGCPVVAADILALRETCAGAVQFCDPDSPEDIATQVLAVLDSPARRQELREAGQARAALFTWARAAAALNDAVQGFQESK
jgi:glycosyltransferase involved in cell wall biosynthesis